MILNLSMQKQLMDEWCWAAVASAVSFFYNNNASGLYQSDIAGQIINPVCSNVNGSNGGDFPQCNHPQDLGTVLQQTQNYAGEMQRALTMTELAGQLNQGYPVCCQINWSGVDVAHYIVVYGLDGNNILVGDPAANNYWADYNYLTNNFGNSNGQWQRSIATQAIQA
jgi:hypothetical protein